MRGEEPEEREPLSDDDLELLQAQVREVIEGGDLPTRKALLQSMVNEIRVVSRAEIYPSFSLPAVRPPCGSVPPAGFEPAPRGLKGRRSNQLSYRGRWPGLRIPMPKITTEGQFYGLAATPADRA